MATHKFHIAAEARNDMDALWLYIAQDNVVAADKVEAALLEAMYLLSDNPLMGHKRADITSDDVRFWNVYSYLIVYDATATPISIIRVLSGYRDVMTVLE